MKKDGTPTKREIWLGLAKKAGYHEDARLWVRVLVERRGVKREDLNAAYAKGRALKAGAEGIRLEPFRARSFDELPTFVHVWDSRDRN